MQMTESWHGIFTILFTPFHDDRSLDEESLRREVDFVIEAGAHGIVAPVNSSEFYLLSDEERRHYAEVLAGAPVALINSMGRVECALAQANAAVALGIKAGDEVRVALIT